MASRGNMYFPVPRGGGRVPYSGFPARPIASRSRQSSKLFIEDIPPGMEMGELAEFLNEFGTVKSLGKFHPRGSTGWVEYSSVRFAEDAMRSNNLNELGMRFDNFPPDDVSYHQREQHDMDWGHDDFGGIEDMIPQALTLTTNDQGIRSVSLGRHCTPRRADYGFQYNTPVEELMISSAVHSRIIDLETHPCAVCQCSTSYSCSRCGLAYYCSERCQREHWPSHAEACNKKMPTLNYAGKKVETEIRSPPLLPLPPQPNVSALSSGAGGDRDLKSYHGTAGNLDGGGGGAGSSHDLNAQRRDGTSQNNQPRRDGGQIRDGAQNNQPRRDGGQIRDGAPQQSFRNRDGAASHSSGGRSVQKPYVNRERGPAAQHYGHGGDTQRSGGLQQSKESGAGGPQRYSRSRNENQQLKDSCMEDAQQTSVKSNDNSATPLNGSTCAVNSSFTSSIMTSESVAPCPEGSLGSPASPAVQTLTAVPTPAAVPTSPAIQTPAAAIVPPASPAVSEAGRASHSIIQLQSGGKVCITDYHKDTIHVRPVDEESKALFTETVILVATHCQTAQPLGREPKRRELVACKFHADGVYYRAIVEERPRKDVAQYVVRFVDYGNRELSTSSDMTLLPNEIAEKPFFAVKTCLKNLTKPLNKKAEELLMDCILSEKVLTVEFTSLETGVDLKYTNGVSLLDEINKLITTVPAPAVASPPSAQQPPVVQAVSPVSSPAVAPAPVAPAVAAVAPAPAAVQVAGAAPALAVASVTVPATAPTAPLAAAAPATAPTAPLAAAAPATAPTAPLAAAAPATAPTAPVAAAAPATVAPPLSTPTHRIFTLKDMEMVPLPTDKPFSFIASAFIEECSTICGFASAPSVVQMLCDLTVKLDQHCSQDNVPFVPQPEELCIVEWTDGAWYRATCSNVEGGDVEVFFVDYGNLYKTSSTNIRRMSEEFVRTPALASMCVLHGVPETPPPAVVNKMKSLIEPGNVLFENVTVHSMKNEVVYVLSVPTIMTALKAEHLI